MIKGILFAIAGVALTWVLWSAFRPTPDALHLAPNAAVVSEAQAALPQQGRNAADERVFELALKEGRLISGAARIQVHEGDRVVLEIVSDAGDELHIHGYDLKQRLAPDEPVKLDFVANRTGRFGLELHRTHTELGALEVYPR